MNYQCQTPVAIITFNRPEPTRKVFDQIRKVKPSKLYFISDGARDGVEADNVNVSLCRDIADQVDWTCDVVRIFSETNLGCKKRVITGLNQVFEKEDSAIILEDDCVPTQAFFEFCDWGLKKYKENTRVAIVSGSNLLDYENFADIDMQARAGFSMYINCWGWATWKTTWNQFDSYLSIQEINKTFDIIVKNTPLSRTEKNFWKGVLRHSIYTRTIWDFYLQHLFFKQSLVSVYPRYNLVENIGFGIDSTHTHSVLAFVGKSRPQIEKVNNIMNLKEPGKIEADKHRDRQVIRTVYGYSRFSTFKLAVGNILRYLGVR